MMKHGVALVLLFCAPMQALAAPQEYTILAAGVHDQQDKAAALAMDYAIKRALFLSATKMGASDIEQKILQLTPEQLAIVIRGATVDKSNRAGTRTYQEIRVTVAEDALRPMMLEPMLKSATNDNPTAMRAQAGEPVLASPPARSILLIPATVLPARTWMWEKENVLRAPLGEEVLRQSRGLVMLPSGDLQDLRLIEPANGPTVKADELQPMFERYGVQEIIVVMVSPGAEGTSDPSRILLHRVARNFVRNEVMEVPTARAEDTTAIRVTAAARAIATAAMQIATSTADDDKEKLSKATRIPVLFTYSTPKELARMTRMLRTAPHVLHLDLPQIALREVRGTAYLEGKDVQELRKYLAGQGVIIREQKAVWNLSLR